MANLQLFLIYSCIFISLIFLIVLVLTRPKYFMLSFIVLAPIVNIFWSYKIYVLSVLDIFYGIFPLLFIFIYVRLKDREWVWGRFNKYFLLVLLVYLIPFLRLILKGTLSLNALELLLKIFFGYAVYCLSINLLEVGEDKKITNLILFAVLVTNMMLVFQLITGNVPHEEAWRMSGLYHDPGQYTRMALLGIIILLPSLKLIRNKIHLVSKYSMLMLCVVTLGYSVSRNVVLSVIAIFIVCGFYLRRYFLIPVLSLSVLGFYLASPQVQDRYEHKFEKEIRYFSSSGEDIPVETLGSGRVGVWERTMESFKESNLFQKFFGTGQDIGPHGQFFGLLSSVGIFGLIISVFLYIMFFKFILAKVRADRNDSLALYSFLIIIDTLVMSVGSAPITNYYLQGILFMFVALLENRDRMIQESESYIFLEKNRQEKNRIRI